MSNLMPLTTTATELQRNYKKVVQKAKRTRQPIVVMVNNKPTGVYMDYEAFADATLVSDKGGSNYSASRKRNLDELFGSWTKEEADNFDKYIEEAFERVDAEDWK